MTRPVDLYSYVISKHTGLDFDAVRTMYPNVFNSWVVLVLNDKYREAYGTAMEENRGSMKEYYAIRELSDKEEMEYLVKSSKFKNIQQQLGKIM